MCLSCTYFLSISINIVPHILNFTIKTALILPVSTVSAQLISTFKFFFWKWNLTFQFSFFYITFTQILIFSWFWNDKKRYKYKQFHDYTWIESKTEKSKIKIALNHFTPHTCVAYDASTRSNVKSFYETKRILALVFDEF